MKLPTFSSSVLLLGGLAITSCSGGGGDAANEILIGEYGSLTGTTATFGISTKNGIDLAIDEVNAAGGVLGKQLRVIVEDDQGRPEEAQTVVTKLITRDEVVAILGEVASSRTLAAAPVAQSNGIPMITPSSTNPKITEVGDYIFRVCFIDPFQGFVMAKFAATTLKVRNVAILTDVKNDHSVGLTQVFTEEFGKLGGRIVARESYSEGDTDFSAQLTSLRARNPDAIYVPGYYTEVGLLARQARQLGLDVPLLGGDGWDSPRLTEIGGPAMNNSYFSSHYSPQDTSQLVRRFVGQYQERFGEVPDGLAALAYDAAKLLADAIARAGSAEPAAIRDAIAQTKGFVGVTGTISINAQRNADKAATVVRVAGGKLEFVETIRQ
ncbi:MAG: ABC transporter substrate-binding protein [Gemmatimonadetes bacterium]|nr:ABC transporter substrate-binding protein [Gemmatimonadota bacterium]